MLGVEPSFIFHLRSTRINLSWLPGRAEIQSYTTPLDDSSLGSLMLLLMVVAVTWDSGFQASPLHSKEGSRILMEHNIMFWPDRGNKAFKSELSKRK